MAVQTPWPHLTPCGKALALSWHVWRTIGAPRAIIPKHIVQGLWRITDFCPGCMPVDFPDWHSSSFFSLMGEAADLGSYP